MIDKIIDSYYLVELRGKAANLEFLLGQTFNLNYVRITSKKCDTDINATVHGQRAMNFFIERDSIDLDGSEQLCYLNPEFFPNAPPVELNEEQVVKMEKLNEIIESKAQNDEHVTTITYNFDPLGDFVSTRLEVNGDGFSAKVRVFADPDKYLDAKSIKEANDINKVAQPHRELSSTFHIH